MGFGFTRTLTIDHTQCGSTDDVNFPVLLQISGQTYIKTTGNGGNVTNSNGYDIGFYSDAALTTKLNWEVESYDGSAGNYIAWVMVPTISHTVDTVIYLAYGNAAITTDQSNPTGTWDTHYKAVYHFANLSGPTTSIHDSTGNHSFASGNLFSNGTSGSANSGISGQIYAGQIWPSSGGNPSAAVLSSQSGLPAGSAVWTIEAWFNRGGGSPFTDNSEVFGWGTNAADGNRVEIACATNAMGVECRNASAFATLTNDASWHQLVAVLPSGQTTVGGILIYIDGTSRTVSYSSGATALSIPSSVDLVFSAIAGATGAGGYYQAETDEGRLSDTDRSADWILKGYNNQKPSSTFLTIGSEVGTASVTLSATGAITFDGSTNGSESLALSSTAGIGFVEASTGLAVSLGLSATPGVSFTSNGTANETLTLSPTAGVSFDAGVRGFASLDFAATPGISFTAARSVIAASLSFSAHPGITFAPGGSHPTLGLTFSVLPGISFAIGGGAPIPPPPPPPPPTCIITPEPSFTPALLCVDEPDELTGS